MDATTPRMVHPQDGDPGFLGSIGVRFLVDGAASDGRFSLVEHPMSPRALGARYALEVQPQSIPELLERFDLRIGEPL